MRSRAAWRPAVGLGDRRRRAQLESAVPAVVPRAVQRGYFMKPILV